LGGHKTIFSQLIKLIILLSAFLATVVCKIRIFLARRGKTNDAVVLYIQRVEATKSNHKSKVSIITYASSGMKQAIAA
jgi:LPS O-antigen subunit length determinant protein (WzzB/FepE family)